MSHGSTIRIPNLRNYMIEMLTYWMREFDLDGFRFDVAHKPPTDFWEEARVALEKVNRMSFGLLKEIARPTK